MFLNILFNILLVVILGYALLKLFMWDKVTTWEWSLYRWFCNLFCKHKNDYEYMARGYIDSKRTMYSIRCVDCHKDIMWIGSEDENNTLLDNTTDLKWKPLSRSNYELLMKDCWPLEDYVIKRIKKMQKNIC